MMLWWDIQEFVGQSSGIGRDLDGAFDTPNRMPVFSTDGNQHLRLNRTEPVKDPTLRSLDRSQWNLRDCTVVQRILAITMPWLVSQMLSQNGKTWNQTGWCLP